MVRTLAEGRNLVLVAPPGAGKTTRVPQAILDGDVLAGKDTIAILEPRRLAARLAARRVAMERGVEVGREVGYQVRFDDRTANDTRIAFLTEGILTRRLQSDPALEGIGAVILDEFHERSIHADLALAFLREVQETLRPDLRIVVMSATLEPEPIARFLGGASVVRAEGRIHPVEIEWLESPDDRSLEERVVSGIRRALRREDRGDVLVFLPGAPEIRRVVEMVGEARLGDVDVRPLYGDLPAVDQDRAIEPGPRRKIVLATNIAESSLTIEGVTIVVDSGHAKVPRHDPALGIDRLELVRISRASAEQRAGRAGRTAPGRAYRLWTRKEDQHLPRDDVPEVMRIDLAPAVLEVIRWSRRDPRTFGWFEPPPRAALDRAIALLDLLGAIDRRAERLTSTGERLSDLPLHPRVAMMLMSAGSRGALEEGALVAALASERDIFRRGSMERARRDEVGASDLLLRLERILELERGGMTPSLAGMLGIDLGAARSALAARDRLLETARNVRARSERSPRADPSRREEAILRAVLSGFPDRLAKRRARGDERFAIAGCGQARLARESVVKESELLVAVEVDLGPRSADSAVIRLASHVERAWLEEDTRGVSERTVVRFNRDREVVECAIEVRYRDLLLEERPSTGAKAEEVARALEEAAEADLDRALPMTESASRLLDRLRFLGRVAPELEGDIGPFLTDFRRALLPDLCAGRRSFADLRAIDLEAALLSRLEPRALARLERNAPARIEVPSGRLVPLQYDRGGPVLSVRLQEVFGMRETPRVGGGRFPVTMELLAPNMRPVQVTQDLGSFWATTYAEVRRELRRRYPKHQWPEDPSEGDPRRKPGRR